MDRSVRRDGVQTGTVSDATTAGTQADGDGDEPPLRFRGDEADLFLAFNPELKTVIAKLVRGLGQADIEDACGFAWVQFFRYQPSREHQSWQGWLVKTAQREAWKLSARRREDRSMHVIEDGDGRDFVAEPADPRDRLQERIEFLEAMDELRKLPESMQRVVLVRSQVHKQQDVADILGVSRQRVNHLLVSVSLRVNELAEQRAVNKRPVASPRAARLRELEDEPPEWLRAAIGRPVTRNRSNGAALLAWRRAALAIDDYRQQHGWSADEDALGPRPDKLPAGRAHDRADRAVSQVREERARARRGGREL